jgi:hypothetical protein
LPEDSIHSQTITMHQSSIGVWIERRLPGEYCTITEFYSNAPDTIRQFPIGTFITEVCKKSTRLKSVDEVKDMIRKAVADKSNPFTITLRRLHVRQQHNSEAPNTTSTTSSGGSTAEKPLSAILIENSCRGKLLIEEGNDNYAKTITELHSEKQAMLNKRNAEVMIGQLLKFQPFFRASGKLLGVKFDTAHHLQQQRKALDGEATRPGSSMNDHNDIDNNTRLIYHWQSATSRLNWTRGNEQVSWEYDGPSWSVVYYANSKYFNHGITHRSFNLDEQNERQVLVLSFSLIKGTAINITSETASKVLKMYLDTCCSK